VTIDVPTGDDMIGIEARNALIDRGHLFLRAPQTRELLQRSGPLTDWETFVESWNAMPVDGYLANGGRYRRRRHANYLATPDGIVRQPHRPHYQSRDYNPLHGGIERWFEPVEPLIGEGASLRAILDFCHASFAPLTPTVTHWFVEVHQFRVEAFEGEAGLPTPEGIHRDGVDWVFVLLIRRHNVRSGVTTIHAPDGQELGSFTLTEALDATLIDDHRVHHGVTPVEPLDPAQPAWRDVLVVTFRPA
jgi:hypothetical protein